MRAQMWLITHCYNPLVLSHQQVILTGSNLSSRCSRADGQGVLIESWPGSRDKWTCPVNLRSAMYITGTLLHASFRVKWYSAHEGSSFDWNYSLVFSEMALISIFRKSGRLISLNGITQVHCQKGHFGFLHSAWIIISGSFPKILWRARPSLP